MRIPLTRIACLACMCPLGLLFARTGVSMTPCRPPQPRAQVRRLHLILVKKKKKKNRVR